MQHRQQQQHVQQRQQHQVLQVRPHQHCHKLRWKGACVIYISNILYCIYSVHMRCEEKLSLVMSRDGGVQSMEVTGLMVLRISDTQFAACQVHMRNADTRHAQVQVGAGGVCLFVSMYEFWCFIV
jgi:hypothetical protein